MIKKFMELERTVEMSPEGSTVRRKFSLHPYRAYPMVVSEILGYIRIVDGRLVRTLPMNDPLLPQCFAKKVSINGGEVFSAAGNVTSQTDWRAVLQSENKYAEAILDVEFVSGTRTSDQMRTNSEFQICTLDFDFSGRSLTLPNEYYGWVNSNLSNVSLSNINATYVMPQMGAQVIRHYTINRPIRAILQLIGKVNAAAFVIQDIEFPAECMHLLGANIKQGTTWNNLNYYEINYKMDIQGIWDLVATSGETLNADGSVLVASSTAYDWVGWNRIYRPDRGYWDYLQTNIGGRKMHRLDSVVSQALPSGTISGFNLLFHPEAK